MLNEENIKKLREELIKSLKQYQSKEKIKLNISGDILDRLIFDYYKSEDKKRIAFDFNLIKKLDLTDALFDKVNVQNIDFTGSKGVKINPQIVYKKSLYSTKLADVEIVGTFDETDVRYTNFKGSKGAKINPQTVHLQSLLGTMLTDVEIVGSLDFSILIDTDFTGSKGGKISISRLECFAHNIKGLESLEIIDDKEYMEVAEEIRRILKPNNR